MKVWEKSFKSKSSFFTLLSWEFLFFTSSLSISVLWGSALFFPHVLTLDNVVQFKVVWKSCKIPNLSLARISPFSSRLVYEVFNYHWTSLFRCVSQAFQSQHVQIPPLIWFLCILKSTSVRANTKPKTQASPFQAAINSCRFFLQESLKNYIEK